MPGDVGAEGEAPDGDGLSPDTRYSVSHSRELHHEARLLYSYRCDLGVVAEGLTVSRERREALVAQARVHA